MSVYTRSLERSAFGVVEYIAVLQLLIQVVIGLELTQGIARYFGGSEDEAERRLYASTGFWTLLGAYGAACAILFVAADRVEALLLGDAASGILRPAVLSIYLGIMFYVVRSQLRWELRATGYAVASVIAVVMTIAVSVYLLLVARIGLVGVFIGLGAGYGSGTAACLYALRGTYALSFDVGRLRQMLGFSLPLTVSSLALLAASYGDRIVVRTGMGFDDLGVYAAGAKIASVIALASAGFQLGAAPIIYRHYRSATMPDALAQMLRLFFAAGLVGVLTLAAVAIELLAIFTAPAYRDGWRVIPVLALATVLGSGYIFLPGLSIRAMTAQFAAISIAAGALSLAAAAGLAQAYGIVGAASGVLVGAAAGFLMHGTFSQRVYALPVDWRRIAAAIVIVLIAIAATSQFGGAELEYLLGRIGLCALAAVAVIAIVLDPADRTIVARLLALPLRSDSRPSP